MTVSQRLQTEELQRWFTTGRQVPKGTTEKEKNILVVNITQSRGKMTRVKIGLVTKLLE